MNKILSKLINKLFDCKHKTTRRSFGSPNHVYCADCGELFYGNFNNKVRFEDGEEANK